MSNTTFHGLFCCFVDNFTNPLFHNPLTLPRQCFIVYPSKGTTSFHPPSHGHSGLTGIRRGRKILNSKDLLCDLRFTNSLPKLTLRPWNVSPTPECARTTQRSRTLASDTSVAVARNGSGQSFAENVRKKTSLSSKQPTGPTRPIKNRARLEPRNI